jgi:hypothetical protein
MVSATPPLLQVFIQGIKLDYTVLQRVFGYSANDFTTKLSPYVLVSTNGDMSTSSKTNTARFNTSKSLYSFDQTLKTFAKQGDRLMFFLVDDNLITKDTTVSLHPATLRPCAS